MLEEIPISVTDEPLSDVAKAFIAEGRARFKTVRCFDFVPSDYELVWRVLAGLPRGTFCEWGSGWGIVTGLAELLGFEACGCELDPQLAEASRALFAEFNLTSPIHAGDYFASDQRADYYFVYCWPSLIQRTEEHFEKIATGESRLLILNGQSDVRCKRVVFDGV